MTEIQQDFLTFVESRRGVSLTPAQRDLAFAIIRTITRNPELKAFVKARQTGVTFLFDVLEDFLKRR